MGASTQSDELSWQESVLLVLCIIFVIILIFVILILFFKQQLVKCCPCLIIKVKPEEKTGLHYVDRFGETKMKFASYNLSEMRARKSDSVEEGSVHTNVSLQVPLFEEKLNGTVKKKSVYMTDHDAEKTAEEKKEKRKKKKRARKNADLGNDLEPISASPSHASAAAPPIA